MSFFLRTTTAAAALLALSAIGTAHATVTASATIGQVTITLIDLDPSDGITPALTFLYSSSNSGAYVGSSSDYDSAAGFYAPTSAAVSTGLGSAAASTDAAGAWSAGQLLGSAAAGSSEYGQGYGNFYANFEVTAWTGVILTAAVEAQASTTVGYDGSYSESGQGGGTLQLSVNGDDGYESHYASRGAYASYLWDGSQYIPESNSFSGTVRLTYANLSNATLSGSYYAEAYSYLRSDIAAVPEPASYALLLAGLVGIATVARRRRN